MKRASIAMEMLCSGGNMLPLWPNISKTAHSKFMGMRSKNFLGN